MTRAAAPALVLLLALAAVHASPLWEPADDVEFLASDGSASGTAGNGTGTGTGSGKSVAVGFVGIALAGFGFGSNFVVIKKREWDPKDGLFFQFNMVIGIFFTGMLYHYAVRGAPPLQPVAMLGGAGWAIGNACCPFIIETIGMGLGLSIWGTANMLTGWSSAHFGILGVSKESVPHTGLNIGGALMACVAILVYAQVKNKEAPSSEAGSDEERRSLTTKGGSINAGAQEKEESMKDVMERKFGKGGPKIAGMIVSVGAGILFGACFNPAQHAIDQAAEYHCNAIRAQESCTGFIYDKHVYCSWDGTADLGKKCGGMPGPDLAFSQFCGIFFASFAIMMIYGTYKQFGQGKVMYVNIPLIVPGVVSGIIWAFAQIGWFVASDNLSMVVSFPIITTLPAILANGYGYFIFGELDTSRTNVIKLLIGICCSITAGILIALSKLG